MLKAWRLRAPPADGRARIPDARAVDAATQGQADFDTGRRVALHRGDELLADVAGAQGSVRGWAKAPVPVGRELAFVECQDGAGRDRMDVGKAGARPIVDEAVVDEGANALVIDDPGIVIELYDALDLGGDDEMLGGAVVVEWSHAERVPADQQAVAARIPDHERPDPAKPFNELLAEFFVHCQDERRIRRKVGPPALRPQGVRELFSVVKVAVERDDDALVRAGQRLLPQRSPPDRGAPDSEEEAVEQAVALPVRAPMGQPTEGDEIARQVRANAGLVVDAQDAAHDRAHRLRGSAECHWFGFQYRTPPRESIENVGGW